MNLRTYPKLQVLFKFNQDRLIGIITVFVYSIVFNTIFLHYKVMNMLSVLHTNTLKFNVLLAQRVSFH